MVVVFWARLLPIRACMRLRPAAPSESPLPVYPSRGAVPGSAVNFQTFQRATFKRSSSPLPSLCLQSTINACEPLQTVDAKRLARTLSFLESALTSHGQLIENTVTLSPLESTLTRFGAVTPLEATRTKKEEGARFGERHFSEDAPETLGLRPALNIQEPLAGTCVHSGRGRP